MSNTELFKQVVKRLGGPVATARLLKLNSYQSVQQMKQFRVEHCPIVAAALNGTVTCEELRPDVDWHLMRKALKAA